MPRLAAALTGAVLTLAPVAPAHASPRTPAPVEPSPGTELRLTLTHPGSTTSATRTGTLRCHPAGGSHPAAREACAQLDEADGRISRPPDGRICTAIYAPVVARAEGTWRGRPVRFRTEYGSDCVMRSRTGAIFAF